MHVAAALAGVAGQNEAAGLLHGLIQLVVVEGHQAAAVYDLDRNTVFRLKLLRGVQRAVERGAEGEDGEVRALFTTLGSPMARGSTPWHAARMQNLGRLL